MVPITGTGAVPALTHAAHCGPRAAQDPHKGAGLEDDLPACGRPCYGARPSVSSDLSELTLLELAEGVPVDYVCAVGAHPVGTGGAPVVEPVAQVLVQVLAPAVAKRDSLEPVEGMGRFDLHGEDAALLVVVKPEANLMASSGLRRHTEE